MLKNNQKPSRRETLTVLACMGFFLLMTRVSYRIPFGTLDDSRAVFAFVFYGVAHS